MKADNSSMMTPSKRDIFLSTYNRHQNFSLPNSMMHYIAKNPKNAKFYQKMIKSCKYFFMKNSILVLSKLRYIHYGWETWINNIWEFVVTNTASKLWITDSFYVSPENVKNTAIASSIIPKIYQCDWEYLFIYHQILSDREFMFLCLSAASLTLKGVTLMDDFGTVILFEKVIEQLPKVKSIRYTFTTPSNYNLKNTFKELWKIPHFSNYDDFSLYDIPEDFDIDSFNYYMKKNKKTSVRLIFFHRISQEYKTRLEAIVDEIVSTKHHEYKPPLINFPGINREKSWKLCNIFKNVVFSFC